MTPAYVISSIIWSAIGFGVGIKFGRLQSRVTEIERQVVTIENAAAPTAGEPASEPHHRHIPVPHWDPQRIVGLVIVIMAAISMAVSFYAAHQQNRATTCQATYFKQYRQSLLARDDAAKVARANVRTSVLAEKDLWTAFLKNAPTRAGEQPSPDQRAADIAALNNYFAGVDAYVASLDAASASATRFPLPTETCP